MIKLHLKAFLLTLLLLSFSSLSLANDCVDITPDSQIKSSIDAECRKQMIGIDASLEKFHDFMFKQNEQTAIKVALGTVGPDYETDSSSFLLSGAIGILGLVLIAVIVIVGLFGVVVAFWQGKDDDKGRSFFRNGAFIANMIKTAIKYIPASSWILFATVALAISAYSAILFMSNIQVINYKQNQIDISTYAGDIKGKSKEVASDDIASVIKYYACVIDHDKRLLFDNSVNADYTFKKSEYQTCMSGDNSKLDETKNTFISRHLYKIKDCGLKHAKLTTANCGSFEFKNDAQQILKDKYIQLEPKLLGLASDYIDYYCSNQTVVSVDSELRNYCWKFNPVTFEVPLDGNGKLTPISSSKSYAAIKSLSKDVEAEISMALIATAVEHFKSFVPSTLKYGVTGYIESKINASKNIKAVKNFNKTAMDYELKYIPEFQYSAMESKIKSTEEFTLGGRQTTSAHNQAVGKIIDSTVALPEDEKVKNLIYKFSNFLGRGFVENMGLKYDQGADYNILSTTIVAGQEAATYLISTSLVLKVAESGFSLAGTRNFNGKPDLKAVAAEKALGFGHDLMFNLGLAIAGSVITLTMMFVVAFATLCIKAGTNIIKLAYLLELSFYIDGIDQSSGKHFSFDDVVRRIITLLYIVLILPAIIYEFEIGFHVSYLLVEIAKENFFVINQSAGYISDSANALMSFVYQFIMMAVLHVVVIISMLIGINKATESVHTILIQKLYTAGDVKSALMLEDSAKMQKATEGHLMSARKAPRSQRI